MNPFNKKQVDGELHAARIEDYAIIGDLETAALVCRNGSIDWLCWPNFSSGACFASLLGSGEHGYFSLRPAKHEAIVDEQWRYLPKTLVVEKTWTTLDGELRVIDFMPPRGGHSDVVRIVKPIRGTVAMRMELAIRFDYGLTTPWVSRVDHHMRAIAGPNLVVLRTDAPLHGEGMMTASNFTIKEGDDPICFVLSYGSSMTEDPASFDAWDAYNDTVKFWTEWMSQSSFHGRPEYRDAVERSFITLKALTYRPSGGQVAAVTTSLPEKLEGERNWDYRFCWLRDASLAILVLVFGGFTEEALAWRGWLLRASAGSPGQLHALYGINGERVLAEWNAKWLPGYENSRPVRIGNAAADQLQLDIFGEVIAALSRTPAHKDDMWNDSARELAGSLLDHLCDIWREPDNGIWEVRGQRQHFVHSKLMAWVAFNRAVTSWDEHRAEGGGDPDPKHAERVDRWRNNRDELRREILEKGFNKKKNAFTQAYGSDRLDAATLRVVLVGFLPGDDPRVVGTVKAIEKDLLRDGLVLRYDTAGGKDGLPGGEGAFLACSFWYVSALHLIGRHEDATESFNHLLSLCNDLGLLAEEYDTKSGRQLGNFPQALTHLALCHSAMILGNAEGPWSHPVRDLS